MLQETPLQHNLSLGWDKSSIEGIHGYLVKILVNAVKDIIRKEKELSDLLLQRIQKSDLSAVINYLLNLLAILREHQKSRENIKTINKPIKLVRNSIRPVKFAA